MIYRQWKDLFSEHDARSTAWLAKWAGLSPEELDHWDLEPEYGAFIGPEGQIFAGNHPSGVSLTGSDPLALSLGPLESLRAKHAEASAWFLDWGAQTADWSQIFALWEEWESDGRVLACGPVQVDFDQRGTWKAPAFVLWRQAPETSPLIALSVVREAAPPVAGLLARAQALRDAQPSVAPDFAYAALETAEDLPMLPFTLQALQDEHHVWPRGVEAFAPRTTVATS